MAITLAKIIHQYETSSFFVFKTILHLLQSTDLEPLLEIEFRNHITIDEWDYHEISIFYFLV